MNHKLKYVVGTLSMSLALSGLALSLQTVTPNGHKVLAETEHAVHWSYEGETGPEHWGELGEANKACKDGKTQSPVNLITSTIKENPQAKPLGLSYVPTKVALVNNGHTIQANAKQTKDILSYANTTYTLAQFHIHTPSEHEVNGGAYPLEIHFVHKSAKGQLAVLGLLVKEGAANAALADMWTKLPKEETKAEIVVEKAVDLVKLLPKSKKTFRYDGSLTTPPCSEGVKWFVFEQSITMSKEQIAAFQAIFKKNNRPVQPLEGRTITKK